MFQTNEAHLSTDISNLGPAHHIMMRVYENAPMKRRISLWNSLHAVPEAIGRKVLTSTRKAVRGKIMFAVSKVNDGDQCFERLMKTAGCVLRKGKRYVLEMASTQSPKNVILYEANFRLNLAN